MVKININVEKKDLWLISAIFVLLVGVGVVVAYNAGYSGAVPGSIASVHGHTGDEIDGLDGSGFENYGSIITNTGVSTEVESDEIGATLASTDLLLFAVVQPSDTSGWIRYGFKGYTSPTSGGTYILRAGMSAQDDTNGAGAPWGVQSFTMFVKKGEYYKVTKQGLWGEEGKLTRTYTTLPVGN